MPTNRQTSHIARIARARAKTARVSSQVSPSGQKKKFRKKKPGHEEKLFPEKINSTSWLLFQQTDTHPQVFWQRQRAITRKWNSLLGHQGLDFKFRYGTEEILCREELRPTMMMILTLMQVKATIYYFSCNCFIKLFATVLCNCSCHRLYMLDLQFEPNRMADLHLKTRHAYVLHMYANSHVLHF